MAYVRKTRDEWQVWGNNGYGWDEYTAEDTRKDGLAQLRCYRENDPTTVYKLIKRRVPIDDQE
jgi:hypothetical protein